MSAYPGTAHASGEARAGTTSLAFVRCYDWDHAVAAASQDLPDWYARWLQRPYLQCREPKTILQDRFAVEARGAERTMERLALAFPHLGILEVVLHVPGVPLEGSLADARPGFALRPVDRGRAHQSEDVSPSTRCSGSAT